jgi:hypothetical protein
MLVQTCPFCVNERITCCSFLDNVVLGCFVRVSTLVLTSGHVISSRVHLHILKPVSFSLSNLPCVCVCVCVCVCTQICIRIWPSTEMMWSEQEVSKLPGSKVSLNHAVVCVLHGESYDEVSVTTDALCMQLLSGDRFVYKSGVCVCVCVITTS